MRARTKRRNLISQWPVDDLPPRLTPVRGREGGAGRLNFPLRFPLVLVFVLVSCHSQRLKQQMVRVEKNLTYELVFDYEWVFDNSLTPVKTLKTGVVLKKVTVRHNRSQSDGLTCPKPDPPSSPLRGRSGRKEEEGYRALGTLRHYPKHSQT